MYADDSTILISGTDVNDLIAKCNDVLRKLSVWSQSNQISINSNKTKVVIFRSKNKALNLQSNIIYEDKVIDIVHEHKILGVTFSAHLGWDTHVVNLCNKLSSVTGVLSRCRDFLPAQVKLQIYNALFASHVNYCSLVWATTNKTNEIKILRLQKRMIRNIASIPYLASTQNAFPKYNIIKVNHLYRFRILSAFVSASNALKSVLISLSSLTARDADSRTRSTEQWVVPRFRTNYKYQALHFNIPTILNEHSHTHCFSRKQLRQYFVNL